MKNFLFNRNNPFNIITILTGLVLSILMVYMGLLAVNIIHSDYMAEDHLPSGAVFIFFILVIMLNPFLRLITRGRFYFTHGSLLTIWIMLIVSASVSEVGLMCQFLPTVAGLFYYSNNENRWAELVGRHIKNYLIIKDTSVLNGFFEGSNNIPWAIWLKMFLPWFFFFITFYFTSICIVSIFQKQWIKNENLQFPINEIPVAMASLKKEEEIIPFLFKNKFFWTGFLISFLICSLNGLNNFFSAFPTLSPFSIPIFRRTVYVYFLISFPVMGFSYFVNSKLSFSLWFFALFFYILEGIFNISGIYFNENLGCGSYISKGGPFFAHFSFGALLFYTLHSIWISKKHLKNVLLSALKRKKIESDEDNLLPYSVSFWGTIFGILLMLLWLIFSGMNFFVTINFVILIFLILFGLTKIVCQAGLFTLKSPSIASSQIVSVFGSKNIDLNTLANLGLSYSYHSDLRTYPFSSVFHSVKLGEKINRNIRPMFWIIILSLITGIFASFFILLKMAYKFGGLNLNKWYFVDVPGFPWKWISSHILYPEGPNIKGIIIKIAGALIMFLLTVFYTKFTWCPFHPLGLSVASTYRVMLPWFSIFCGWLLKTIILQLGGANIYHRSKPFFIGLIVGPFVASGIWFFVGLITGIRDYSIFLT